MNTLDRIKQLEAQIKSEKEKMSNCKHDFDEPFHNLEKYKEEVLSGTYSGGADIWADTHFVDRTRSRWSRKCKLCGFEEHTYKQRPVISTYEPDFK